jgi:hypothetical protein
MHFLTLSIEAYENIKFTDPGLNFNKNGLRLALFDTSKFNDLIGKLASIALD